MKYVVYERESLIESIASDGFTFLMLIFSIWFSEEMGSAFWMIICAAMLFIWLSIKLPMETDRVKKLKGKEAAIKWAESLPEDE